MAHRPVGRRPQRQPRPGLPQHEAGQRRRVRPAGAQRLQGAAHPRPARRVPVLHGCRNTALSRAAGQLTDRTPGDPISDRSGLVTSSRHTPPVTQPAQTARIVRPRPVAVQTVWPGEATHFTPWLAENLDWLDALGLRPLGLGGTEVKLPTVNRNLDILARTPDGRTVAIENQYLKTDHDHLTRGLAYAVGHEAKALVVISEDHGAEFVAIADFLNSAYEQMGEDNGIAVFLVRLAVEQIGESFVPRFTVVSRPNTWLAAVHGEDEAGSRTVSAFLDACAEPVRKPFKAILDDWAERPGTSMR